MPASTLSGSRMPTAAGRLTAHRDTATFLSRLDRFCDAMDANERQVSAAPTAQAAVLMNVHHFRLSRPLDRASSFLPVCGLTWTQGLNAVLELASQAAGWAMEHGIDPQDERLKRAWDESVSLAWFAELTARVHLLPAPYWSWQAGMLLATALLAEQMRLLEADQDAPEASLGQSAIRQIENLVIQHDLSGSLSIVTAVRKRSYLGPWPCLLLAHRHCKSVRPMAWAARTLERLEFLPTTPALEKCLEMQTQHRWGEFLELARRAWQAGVVQRHMVSRPARP